MEIIPAVDILGGRVVRLTHGDFEQVTVYGDDPAAAALRWADQGARIIHAVDLAGARSGTSDPALWRSLNSAGVPFQVGGGIREAATAEAAVAAGAHRVVVGTAAVWNRATLDDIVAAVGGERVVAAIDVRDGRATGAGWEDAGRPVADVVWDVSEAGVRSALVTGIGRDGTMAGPDLELLEEVRRIAPGLEVIASGGVGDVEDIVRLRDAGFGAVIIGRALYEERFTLAEAIEVAGRGGEI